MHPTKCIVKEKGVTSVTPFLCLGFIAGDPHRHESRGCLWVNFREDYRRIRILNTLYFTQYLPERWWDFSRRICHSEQSEESH